MQMSDAQISGIADVLVQVAPVIVEMNAAHAVERWDFTGDEPEVFTEEAGSVYTRNPLPEMVAASDAAFAAIWEEATGTAPAPPTPTLAETYEAIAAAYEASAKKYRRLAEVEKWRCVLCGEATVVGQTVCTLSRGVAHAACYIRAMRR